MRQKDQTWIKLFNNYKKDDLIKINNIYKMNRYR